MSRWGQYCVLIKKIKKGISLPQQEGNKGILCLTMLLDNRESPKAHSPRCLCAYMLTGKLASVLLKACVYYSLLPVYRPVCHSTLSYKCLTYDKSTAST